MKLAIVMILIIPVYTAAQDISPAELRYFRQKIDSLPYYIETGIGRSLQKCELPRHRDNYSISGLSLPGELATSDDARKDAYARVCAFNHKAAVFFDNKDQVNAARCWQQALAIAIEENFNFEELHNLRVAINNLCFLAGDYAGAMKISSEGLERSEKLGDRNRMAHFNNVIGYIHMKQGNLAEANHYFSMYLELAQKTRDSLYEAHALYNLADLAIVQKRYDTAIAYLGSSIRLYRLLDKSSQHPFSLPEREAYILNKMAEAWKLKGDMRQALHYALVTTGMLPTEGSRINDYDEASYYINAGDIYNRLQLPDSALLVLRQGMSIARRIIHREHIRDAAGQMAKAFAQRQQFDSAYHYHLSYNNLADSIFTESSRREILQREANRQIQEEKAKQQRRIERQRLWQYIVIGIAMLSVIIVYLLYNRYRLRQQNRQQQEILRTTIKVQDEERKRVAEDLHDSLGSILSAAKLKLSAVEETKTPGSEEKDKLRDTLALLDEALAEMKNIAYNIMPATLSRLGLTAALESLFNRISSRSALHVTYHTHGLDKRLDEFTELNMYRIILESVNNVVRHAGASNVTVQLVKYPDYINISVEDDGCGFEKDLVSGGHGLANIASRVKNLDGTLDIDSRPGGGTTVFVDIPYK
jgi:two-component system NarL family sensor kinase